MMRRALELAVRGLGQTAPNPMVGAVVVRDGEVVGEGWHERYGGPHAEVIALAAAGARAGGAHLYVTLEPCSHHGKTPPCVDAILSAGVARVTIASLDPTTAGGGAELLERAGVIVRTGLCEEEARELNAPFFFAARSGRPWVTLKLALSSEGAIAPAADLTGTRRQQWLTGDAARREVHRMRAESDAIAVGIGTVLADDPQLTVRAFDGSRRPPLRIVFDRHGRLPLESHLVRTAGSVPTVVVVEDGRTPRARELAAREVDVVAARGLEDALRLLHGRGVHSLLLEGGAMLAGAFIEADLVDRLVLLRSPVQLGPRALDALACVDDRERFLGSLHLLERRALDSDILEVFSVEGHVV
jgi:diaminohydroxyphosphoribosylaminopyrimidine deaminase / 5-amino-6-(5-phosphoribosylamino)uracil reductase